MHTLRMEHVHIDLAAIRRSLKLTQPQLAEMAGVNLSTVWRWENEGVPKRGAAKAFIDRLIADTVKSSKKKDRAA
ncbi:DNA-binding transcriptional regulator [Pseudochrobactrum sp. XF203]|uniref:helix-turn-helix domain-containing protein n=1 Tax=Pseudochrobactrum sp. XF203 TaxID=2879116 RepID=UPI001CE39983|nr:helix-turn-helix transcriptional regulator [Pseudochrobactrum sp. XF203]UCA47709.1 helix-turn-helix domain-containing protein [Pseudochrobactrum sp. XF203]